MDSIATKLLEKETLDENEVYAAAGIDRPRDDSNLSGAEASPAAPAPPPDTPPDDSGTAAPAGPTPPSSLWGPPQGSPSS